MPSSAAAAAARVPERMPAAGADRMLAAATAVECAAESEGSVFASAIAAVAASTEEEVRGFDSSHARSVARGVWSMSALALVTYAKTRSTVTWLTGRPVPTSYHGASAPQPPLYPPLVWSTFTASAVARRNTGLYVASHPGRMLRKPRDIFANRAVARKVEEHSETAEARAKGVPRFTTRAAIGVQSASTRCMQC